MTENLYMPDCVRTYSGQYVNFKEPDTKTIYPIDIAVQLSRICRFGGATSRWYSVAEHSLWCSLKAEEMYGDDSLSLKLLMHDAHEYILCDVAKPVKGSLLGYGSLATKVQNAIQVRFGFFPSATDRSRIEAIDKMAMEWEWENKVLSWKGLELPPTTAAELFLDQFKKLCKTPFVIKP